MTAPASTPTPADALDLTCEIARDLIRFDTSNYGEGRSNGETDAAEYVAEKLRALGLAPAPEFLAWLRGMGIFTDAGPATLGGTVPEAFRQALRLA